MMPLKPVSTEKAVKLMDVENTLVFETSRNARKEQIKDYIEKLLEVKISAVRTLMRKNKKFVYVRFSSANPAADLATKLGMI